MIQSGHLNPSDETGSRFSVTSKYEKNLQTSMEVGVDNYNSTMAREECINVEDATLNPVKEFTYLGIIKARDGHIEAKLQRRMSKASMSFGRLPEGLCNNHNVSTRVNLKIYRANIQSTLQYGAESGTVHRSHVKKIHAFMMRHLRQS